MFKIATIVLLALTQPFSDAAIERKLSNFLSEEEINLIFECTSDGNAKDPFEASRWTAGKTPSTLVERLAKNSPYNHGRWLRSGEDGDKVLEEGLDFQIKTMKETTSMHFDEQSDSCYTQHGPQKPSTFVFLNTNEKAFFVHDGQKVPVMAGTLVNFQADKPHRTLIEEGVVQMLVPFTRRRLMPPNGECNGEFSGPRGDLGNSLSNPDEPGTICCVCDAECPADRPICGNPNGNPSTPACDNYYSWNAPVCCPGWDENDITGSKTACETAGVCSNDFYPGNTGYCMDEFSNIYPLQDILNESCGCDDFKNHGQYMKCIIKCIKKDGCLDAFGVTEEQKEELIAYSAESECSK